jgi:hypothetical protein
VWGAHLPVASEDRLRCVFTQVPRRGVLRSPYPGFCIEPRYFDGIGCLEDLGAGELTHYMSRIFMQMRSGASTAFPQSTTIAKEAGVGRS